MARCADCGPYSLTNCFICSFEQNVREGRILLVEKLGKGSKDARGWTYIAGRKSPYQVVYGRRYIGVFKTQSEAELAYAAACLEHGVNRKIAEQPLSVFFAPQGYSTGFKNHEPA